MFVEGQSPSTHIRGLNDFLLFQAYRLWMEYPSRDLDEMRFNTMKSSIRIKSSLLALLHSAFRIPRSPLPTPHSPFPIPQSAIIVLFIAMLAASWQRWTQPLIDHGREMNLPARVLAGERLYSDVQFLYGPFAPHFNALLYRVFGIHLSVLKVSGAVCALLILLMTYRLARTLMSDWESVLAAGLALVICALKSTANYIQPYAYAALYSLVFALGSLSATVNYIRRRSERQRSERQQSERRRLE